MKIQIDIPGIPAPGGSKRAFFRPGMKRAVIVDAAGERNKNWRATCALAARQAYQGQPLQGPLQVSMIFTMPRPQGHYGAKGLKASAPNLHTKRPDALKLARSTEDALTGIVWGDDAQTALLTIEKRYGDRTGAVVVVEVIHPAHSQTGAEQ